MENMVGKTRGAEIMLKQAGKFASDSNTRIVPFSRIHPLLGAFAERVLDHQAQNGAQERQEDGAGLMGLMPGPPAHGSGEAAPDPVLKASGALSVLWRALQHASDAGGPPPCRAWLEILAQSPQQ
jgi:hypothetical protein